MRLKNYFPVFLVILLFTSSCVVQESPVTGNKRAYAYSWSQEVQIGGEVDQEISAEFGIYEDSEINAYFNEISEELLENSHMRREDTSEQFRETEFTFRVLDSPVVNAFALPGGYVYVTRGLMAHLNNEAQLAVVIGHEIGHVAARHASQRGLQQALGQVAVVGGAILGQELLGLPGESLLNLSGQAAQLLFLSYGRDHERESDRLGVEYAARTGYAAAEGAAFFTSLKRITERAGGGIPNLLSSHPDPGERELSIPEKAREWEEQGFEQTIRNTDTYMQMINGIVYGENPRQGFSRDGMFYHPDLEFQFPIPSNWQVINQPAQVVLLAPDEQAVMIFQIDFEAESARASVQNFLNNNEIDADSQRALQSSNRFDGYEAEFTLLQDSQNYGFNMYAVEYDGRVYNFLNYSSQSNYSNFRSLFRNTTTGFNRVTTNSILNINPVTLRVQRMGQAGVFQDQLPSSLPMDIDREEVAILNQVNLTDRLPAGTWIKIPTQ